MGLSRLLVIYVMTFDQESNSSIAGGSNEPQQSEYLFADTFDPSLIDWEQLPGLSETGKVQDYHFQFDYLD